MEVLELIWIFIKLIAIMVLYVGLPVALLTIIFQKTIFFSSKTYWNNRNTEKRQKLLDIAKVNATRESKLKEKNRIKKLEEEKRKIQKISHLETKLSDIYLSTWGKYQALGDATKIETMSGIEFEKFVGKLFVSMGYDITFTPVNNDQGADLIAKKDNDKTAIQVKRYKKNVGNNAVQEAIAGAQYHNCNKTCVVTNSTFTKSAKELAKRSKTKLIDGKKLFSLIEEYLNEVGAPYDYDTFINNKTVILSFFPNMRRLINSVESEIRFLENSYGTNKKADFPFPRPVTKNKPNKCPKCGATQIADILYGMPADYSQIQEDIKAGLIVLGGCCITGNDPKWECVSCNKKI